MVLRNREPAAAGSVVLADGVAEAVA